MIKNYLTIAWRSLIKSRSIAIINLSGLVVGISGALFIGLFILDEIGESDELDHLYPEQIDQGIRSKLTTHFRTKLTTLIRAN